ncbi:ABC transporter permease [Chloroflexota bacterium]
MRLNLLLTFRALKTRPTRTLLTMAGIVLGVAVILAISVTNNSTMLAITTLFTETSGKAHLVITSSDSSGQGFSENVLRRIDAIPGVKAAIPTIRVGTLLADESSPEQVGISFFGASADQLLLYGIDPLLDAEAREYKLVAGQFLPDDLGAYDVVLVGDFADEKEIQVGDDIDLLTPLGVETVRVVGLLSKEGPGQVNNGAFGVLPLRAAQEIFSRVGDLDQIDIVAKPQAASAADLDHLQALLQERLGDKYSVVYPASQGKRVIQMLDVYQMGLGFFSVIALFVGSFLIYNAFSMTVVERTREIGMMRAVGMTRGQVMRLILTEATFLGILGSAVGVGLGILLSRGSIRAMEWVLGQEVKEIPVPAAGLATSIAIGVVVTLVAAAIPAWQAGRVSPLEALRIRGTMREGCVIRSGWIVGLALIALSVFLLVYESPLPPVVQEQIASSAVFPLFLGATLLIPATIDLWERVARPFARRIYGNEGQLGSRNVKRAKQRTTLTVAALMIGVAMILSIQAMTAAFKHDIEAWIDDYIGGDLYVHSSLPMRTDFGRRLEAVEGVADVTPMRYLYIKAPQPDGSDDELAFMAVDPASYSRVTSFSFASNQGDERELMERLAAGDSVFISSVVSERYGLNQGDRIRLRTRRGQMDFEVAAVVADFYNQGLVVEGSWKDMRRYFGVNDVSAFLVKAQPGYAVDDVEQRIDTLYGERRHLTMESNEAIRSRALGLTGQAFSLFDVVAAIGMVIASLGVVNTLTMNVLERTQEIGMLRGVGMTRTQVGKMILAEAGMLGALGGVYGLGFGLFLSRLFLTSPATMQGYELTYVVPVQGIVVGLLVALLISQLAAIWPARRAAGIRIVEAIQYE